MHHIDERTFSIADKVICDTKAHAEFFVSEFRLDKEKTNVLYLEADKEIYNTKSVTREETLRRILGIDVDKSLIVLYFGSVLPLQGADIVYEAMAKLMAVGGYTCIFVGPTKKLRGSHFCKDICHIDWLKQEDLAGLIEVSDICLAGHFNSDIDKAKRTIPGKAFIYEAMGKTMVLGESPANREFFDESDKHIFVEMGSASSIVEACNRYR